MQTTLSYSNKNSCIIHINSTQNNTILTATDLQGQLLKTSSVGSVLKSKRGKRSVPQGALLSGEFLGSFLMDKGFSTGQILLRLPFICFNARSTHIHVLELHRVYIDFITHTQLGYFL